jgi:hypothetical protein
MKITILKTILTISIIFNIFLIGLLVYQALNGCAEIANGRMGVLTEDIEVGYFGSDDTIFKLPKGLAVREASATGADWFEPYRFRIVVTSDSEALVDYSVNNKELKDRDSEYYSAEVRARRIQK